MPPLHTLQCSHGLPLVLLSYLISVAGSYCFLRCAVQISRLPGRLRLGEVVPAAVAMGGAGIWAMHFIAMTACRLPVPVTYDPALTLDSLLVAVAVTGVGLLAVRRDEPGRLPLLAGGILTGVGIAAMHYTGIAAMRLPAHVVYRPWFVLASVLIAIGASILALWLAFRLQAWWQRLGNAFVLAGAVCGMHYSGMAAAVFIPDRALVAPQPVHGAGELGSLTFGITLSVLALLLMASRLTDARRAQEKLRRGNEELQALARRLTAVREEEGARIAREVHDEVGQLLTALRLDVAWLERTIGGMGGMGAEIAGKLVSMSAMLDTSIDVVNRVMTELRPAILDSLGLEAAVEWYVQEFAKRTGIACRLRAGLGGAASDRERATALFRILQEALTNVARHAGAREVDVRLAAEGGRVVLEITDDGRGLPPEKAADARSLGLLGMRERARALGGEVVFRRGADIGASGAIGAIGATIGAKGTTVEVTIPL